MFVISQDARKLQFSVNVEIIFKFVAGLSSHTGGWDKPSETKPAFACNILINSPGLLHINSLLSPSTRSAQIVNDLTRK